MQLGRVSNATGQAKQCNCMGRLAIENLITEIEVCVCICSKSLHTGTTRVYSWSTCPACLPPSLVRSILTFFGLNMCQAVYARITTTL